MKKILVLVLFLIIGLPFASAHPFIDKTIPVQFSNVPEGTFEIIVFYSEAVEINFSTLEVLDSNGRQIDNKDTKYYKDDNSLVVTTQPLKDDTYTVTSKVLSRVDGHLVNYAFVFAIGNVKIDSKLVDTSYTTELILLPEAGSRFPGLIGQTIVLGAVIASMFVWRTQRKDLIKDDLGKLEKLFHDKFVLLVGIGLIIVFASNILMLMVYTMRLEIPAIDALQTTFGMTWVIRMTITILLLGVWFGMEHVKKISFKNQIPLLILSLMLIGTTTMLGHGMASEQSPAIVLDYIHNLVSAIWIGGIIFFAFTLLPSFEKLNYNVREKMALAAIPRFSIMIVIVIGIIIISGPILMWFLESDLRMIVGSTYGKLIIIKILLAVTMIGIGGYHQFVIQKKAEKNIKSGTIQVSKKLKRSLKAEVVIGIMLLGIVALLTNGTLPDGEIQTVQAQKSPYGFSAVEFTNKVIFNIEIFPFTDGINTIKVKVTDLSENPIADINGIKVKISNPQKNISPIVIPMVPIEQNDAQRTEFQGEVIFGFSGEWQVEVEAQRTQNANEVKILNLFIKPRLGDLSAQIIEHNFPEAGAPLYPQFDGKGNIWITDASAPRLWKFSIQDEKFTKYEFDGKTSIILTIDNDGKVWFTDISEGNIGYIDPNSGKSQIIELPDIIPIMEKNYPIQLDIDDKDGVWISIINKNVLVRYDQRTEEFETYELPTSNSGPFAIVVGPLGKIWFSQQTAGQIGYLDPNSGKIVEIVPDVPLATPETIIFDKTGNLWIAEHQEGGGITKYDPFLDSFDKIQALNDAAFPNSAVFDRYQNVWFAQHTIDAIAAYDPHNKEMIEVPIPTTESWIQFTTSDDKDNIWFVEQKPSKLGMLKLTKVSNLQITQESQSEDSIKYTEIVSPLISLGIIAAALFFVKGIRDKKRINSLVYE